jgi:hypothetical protein
MNLRRAIFFVVCVATVAACSAPQLPADAVGEQAVCLGAPIQDGRVFLVQHREELTAQIVRREISVIADGGQDTIRIARLMHGQCGASEQQVTPEMFRQALNQFADGFSTPNDRCDLRASPTSDETRAQLMDDLLSSGLGGVALTQVDGDYLEISVGAACELSEPLIREYLDTRGVGHIGRRSG